jgi:hypothetical protein
MIRNGLVRKPSEGALPLPRRACLPGRRRRGEGIETLRRRRSGANPGEEARERRSGGIPIKAFVRNLGRVKPTGASSSRRAKHTYGC